VIRAGALVALLAGMPGSATAAAAMHDVAGAVRTNDPDTRFRAQIVAGRYADAIASIAALRRVRRSDPSFVAPFYPDEIFARAALASNAAEPDRASLRRAFREVVGRLGPVDAAYVARLLEWVDDRALQRAFDAAWQRHERGSGPPADDGALVRAYELAEVYRAMHAVAAPAIAEDDARRYVVSSNVLVRTPDGAHVCALVVRPRATARATTLLGFTIYADRLRMGEARLTAAHGYAGVVGFTRGKRCSPDAPVPYEHDGADADALIRWIARQPWSDGRVGMYGGSYNGFTTWAAAKRRPAALQALMPQASAAPGIDVPMEGNIFQTFVYYWPLYAATGRALDDAALTDNARWDRMESRWYASGRPYRDLDRIDGTPNPFFDRWLTHPSYDAYWRSMIPDGREFARIDIPVLSTTGYYDGGMIGALYYVRQLERYGTGRDHYLLIGPYSHGGAQHGTVRLLGGWSDELQGYRIDPEARIDLETLRYAWFDYVFRHARKPAILRDAVNFEVMGANRWGHARSLETMSAGAQRLYLTVRRDGAFRVLGRRASPSAFTGQTVDFRNRADVAYAPASDIITTTVDTHDGIAFATPSLRTAADVSGLFSGDLDVVANKKDVDINVALYEHARGALLLALVLHAPCELRG